MSSAATEFEYTSSLEKDGNIYLTNDKQYQYFNDLQGGNYSNNSNEVKFELISLANTNQFINWSESFFYDTSSVVSFRINGRRWSRRPFRDSRECFRSIVEKWVPTDSRLATHYNK